MVASETRLIGLTAPLSPVCPAIRGPVVDDRRIEVKEWRWNWKPFGRLSTRSAAS